ncbi:uncharacterized protein ACB058_010908 [Synchiropus picturatus]
MSTDSKSVLDSLIRTEGGLTGGLVTTNGGLSAEDEIVAATVHLDHLNQSDLMNVLKTLKQFDSNVEVLTKKDLDASADVGVGLGDAAKALGVDHGLGTDLSASASPPDFSLPGVNGKLNSRTPDVGAEINGPSLNADKNLKYHAPKFTMPSFNLPTVPTANVSGDVDLPSVSGNVDAPRVNLSGPDVNLDGPDLNGPSVKVDTPTVDINGGGKLKWYQKLRGLKVKGPEADINTPGVKVDGDLDPAGIGIHSPKIGVEAPEVKGTDMDLNLAAPKHNWKLKKTKPGLNLNTNAGVDVPKPNVNGDVDLPDVDLKAEHHTPGLKIGTWKKPKFGLGGTAKSLDADVNLSAPEASVKPPDVPKVDVKGADLDIEPPKWWHKLKPRKFHGPKLKAAVSEPDLNLAVDTPKANVDVPDVDAEIPSGKFKLFKINKSGTLKAPKASINPPDANIQAPDLHVSSPNLSVQAPDLSADVNVPKADVSIGTPETKHRLPKLKLPKFGLSAPRVKGPTVDPDLNIPSVDVDGNMLTPELDANIEGPNVDMDTNKKFKLPDFKFPKIGGSAPKVQADLDAPELEVPPVKLDGSLSGPNLEGDLPGLSAEAPGVNLDGPDLDLNAQKKIKLPDIKFPKFGASAPKADLDGPGLDVSPVDIDGSLSGPKLDADLPGIKLEAPDVDMDANKKFKLPDFKLPKFGGSAPKVKADLDGPSVDVPPVNLDGSLSAPQLQADLPGVKVDAPGLDIEGPEMDTNKKFKLPDFKLPKFGGSAPKVKADLDGPSVDVPSVNLDGSLSAPQLQADLPGVKVDAPGLDIDGPEMDANKKFKLPDFKLPKFGGSAPKVKADLDGPNVDVPPVNLDGSLSAPQLQADLPGVKVDAPGLDIEGPDMDMDTNKKFKLPDFKLPKFGGSAPKVKADLDGPDVDVPTVDLDGSVSGPKLEGELPGLNVEGPDVNVDSRKKFKMPDLKLPKLGGAKLKAPDVPDANLDLPAADVSLPKASVEGPSFSSPNLNLNAASPDLSLNAPSVSGPQLDVDLPKAGVSGPGLQLKSPNVDLDSGLSKSLNLNLPGISGPEIKSPSADVELKAPKLEAGADVNLQSPHVDVEKPSKPHIKFPKLSFSRSKSVEVTTPDAEVKASLDSPELSADVNAGGKSSPKSQFKWPFKWGLKSNSGTDEEEGGDTAAIDWTDPGAAFPQFKTHKLPKANMDSSGGIEDMLRLNKIDTDTADYVVSKGIRLPVLNTSSRPAEKIDLMERLRLAKEKVPSHNSSPTEAKTDIGMKLAAASLNAGLLKEAEDSSLVRGGTFKVEKPGSVLGLAAPEAAAASDSDRLALSLDNMLGLNLKDSEAE